MQLQQRRLKKLQLHKLHSIYEEHFLLNFDLLKGDISFYAFFPAVARFFPFLDVDCVFRYLVTLHERFICLDMKLLPKRK